MIILNKIENYGNHLNDVFSSFLERKDHCNPRRTPVTTSGFMANVKRGKNGGFKNLEKNDMAYSGK